MHEVHCVKLKKHAEGLDAPPLPGKIGEKIYQSVSKEAWQQWLAKQTMIINEQRLTVFDPAVQEWLHEQMQQYLFEDKEIDIAGYIPSQ